jgi:hypothetical protein
MAFQPMLWLLSLGVALLTRSQMHADRLTS